MKKLLSAILCMAMLSSLPVSAAADPMSDALAAVKTRVTVPADLTEFDSNTTKDGDETSYSFSWRTEDGGKSLHVYCDEFGRINNYSYWDRESYKDNEDNRLTPYTSEDALKFAEEFLKKALPDAYGETSELVWDKSGSEGYFSGDGINYNFTFDRLYEGTKVDGNYVSVNVTATQDGMSVRNMYSDYNYDTEFIVPQTTIENPEEAYKKAYPISLLYETDYEKTGENKTKETRLVYSINGGYISAETGEIKELMEYDGPIEFANKQELADAASGAADKGAPRFTEQEQKELDSVKGLKTVQEIEKNLRGISVLKMTSGMKLTHSYIYKVDDDDYIMNLNFNDDKDRWASITVDAKTGKIKSVNNYNYGTYYPNNNKEEYTVTEEQKDAAREKANEFFAMLEPEISKEYEIADENTYSSTVRFDYSRMANGIKYSEDYADISYDVKENMLTGYDSCYSDANFPDPENVIDANKAYDEILKIAPLEKVYILTDSKQYELCYIPKNAYASVDAFTGKTTEPEEQVQPGKYTDINGDEWYAEAEKRLSDIGIRLSGTEFRANDNITKSDILRIFSAGLKGRNYLYFDDSAIVSSMAKIGIIPPIEKPEEDNSPVTREDACVYMIRLAGFERVAKLSDIYSVSFADGDSISPEKIGYAAILSGMGVVAGSNGTLRPKDYITRAEAVQMLYKYLLP